MVPRYCLQGMYSRKTFSWLGTRNPRSRSNTVTYNILRSGEKRGERSGIKDVADGTHETRAARELELIDSQLRRDASHGV